MNLLLAFDIIALLVAFLLWPGSGHYIMCCSFMVTTADCVESTENYKI